ncbi:metal-sensitive transcriptional regulator [Sinimarinibacterium thermocellulolyticum]|uniref:Metal-sensitive transcriptional regulator n=1 Tax=Sinimarinibacterium thermocellulolyticum TaxID=3170016 RepID=A0ABV2ABZ6_9GAMM
MRMRVVPTKATAETHPPQHSAESKQALIARLKRIEGQLRGIQAMIDRDEGCERVLQQMAAARRALERAFYATVACAYEFEACAESANERLLRKVHAVSDLLVKYG